MAFDTFIVIDDGAVVKGETRDSVYAAKGGIEIFSFSWGASNPTTVGSNGGLSGGKVSISSFNIMKRTDSASPTLLSNCCTGTHFKKVEVFMRKATGDKQEVFLRYTFTDVMVESVQWSGSSGGDDTPTESVSLAFAKVEVGYKPQKEDNTLGDEKTASWDLSQVTK